MMAEVGKKSVEKLEHLYFVGRNIKLFIYCGKQFGGSSKIKININIKLL